MKRLRVLTSIALLRRLQCLKEKGRERERGREEESKRGREGERERGREEERKRGREEEKEREYKINKPLLYDMISQRKKRKRE